MYADPDRLAVQAANDPQSFVKLYECYFKRVYNYIRYRCYEADTADDLTAQVFNRLLECIGQYEQRKGPFEAWLFAITRNVINAHYRKQRYPWIPWDALLKQPASDLLPEDAALRRETKDELLEALKGLDERSRDVISLKFAAGLHSRQIAEITGLSESNVRVILYRALGQLRQALAQTNHISLPGVTEKEAANERA